MHSRRQIIATTKRESHAVLAAAIMIGVATIFVNVSPLITGLLATEFGLSNARLGELMGIPLLAGGTVLITQIFWLRSISSWRIVLVLSILGSAAGYLVAIFAQGYLVLLLSFIVLGMGFGSMYGMSMTLISDSQQPDKGFGLAQLFQKIITIVLLLSIQSVIGPRYGFAGTMILIMTITLLCIGLLRFVPSKGLGTEKGNLEKAATSVARKDIERTSVAANWLDPITYPTWFAGLALALLMIGFTGLWVFMERLGTAAGLSASYIGIALTASTAVAGAATFVPIVLGDKVGRVKPMVVAACIYVVALALFENGVTEVTFVVANVSIFSAYAIAAPYAFGQYAKAAHSYAMVFALPPMIVISSGMGPVIAGWVYSDDTTILLTFSGFCVIACVALVVASDKIRDQMNIYNREAIESVESE